MRFDIVQLPNHVAGMDPPFDVYYRQLLEEIVLAEELGFTCWWFTEHHLIPYGGPIPDPAVFIAAAAARTSRIRFGCSVSVLPLHHPIQVAEDYAMVDVLSGGRLEFGMGVGNNPFEYGIFGVPLEEGRERYEEAVEIILKVWANERVSDAGKFWQFEDVSVYPRPVQRPHPPLWVAGLSEGSLGFAGRLGRNIMIVAHPRPPEEVRPGVDAWRAGLEEGGPDPSSATASSTCAPTSTRTAPTPARWGRPPSLGTTSSPERGFRPPRPDETDWDGMLRTGRNIYGNPEQCIEVMRRSIQHYGFDISGMQFNFGGIPHDEVVKAMRLFAREVMPAFQ